MTLDPSCAGNIKPMVCKTLGYIKHWKQKTLAMFAPGNIGPLIDRTLGNTGLSKYRTLGTLGNSWGAHGAKLAQGVCWGQEFPLDIMQAAQYSFVDLKSSEVALSSAALCRM